MKKTSIKKLKKDNEISFASAIVTIIFFVFIIIAFFYYADDTHSDTCLERFAEEYCLNNNFTTYQNIGNNYFICYI